MTLSEFKKSTYASFVTLRKRVTYYWDKRYREREMIGANDLVAWENAGRPIPPPAAYKQDVIRAYQKKFGIDYLIESGTFTGHTVDALKNDFAKIDSIEIEPRLFNDARKKFKKYPNVNIILGDTKFVLPQLISKKNEAAIYWLDGHYSWGITGMGEKITPILDELRAVLSRYQGDVILIDDARLFVGEYDYPMLDDLLVYIGSFNLNLTITNHNDIIRVHQAFRLRFKINILIYSVLFINGLKSLFHNHF
jgi:hypothetical protein